MSKAVNYNFTSNWFVPEQPQWQYLLSEYKGKKINVLEIGVYEGRATVWMLENLFDNPESTLVAIDTFKGSPELKKEDLVGLYDRFLANIKISGKENQVKIIKDTSYNSLIKFNYNQDIQFDFIYVDASHFADDVLRDLVLAWPILCENGIMIMDDYAWYRFAEEYNRPKIAIDAFLACHQFEIEILEINFQVTIRKVKKERKMTRTNWVYEGDI